MSEPVGLIHRTVAARAGGPPHPVLVLLHGRGSHEQDLLSLAPHLDARFFVVSVRAPLPFLGGYAWYELAGPGRQDLTTFRRSLGQLGSLVEALPEAYPIDPARLYLLGFSQGAMMSNALTLTRPERVAGAVLLSGFQPPLEHLSVAREGVPGKPAFVAHGTLDEILPIENGRAVREALSGLGLDLTYREYQMGHQIIGPELDEIAGWLSARLEAGPSGRPG